MHRSYLIILLPFALALVPGWYGHSVRTNLSHGQDVRATMPDGFDLLPAEASAALVIPHLKRASDDLTRMLEGMERAHVLLGARPMDQLRAMLGLQIGVNELDAAAIVVMPGGDDAPIFVIPVTAAADFLESNFDPVPGGLDNAYLHADGSTVYTKTLDKHVALSRSAALIDRYAPQPGFAATLGELLTPRTSQVMANGEIILYADQNMIRKVAEESARGAIDRGFDRGFDLMASAWIDATTAAIAVTNFDPLGLGLSTFVAIDPESSLAGAVRGGESALAPLSRVPNKPFYFAASVDLAGLGGTQLLEALFPDGFTDLPQWVREADGIQLLVAPSPLGLQGGLLNDAVLFIATDAPGNVLTAMRERVLASGIDNERMRVTPTWTAGARLIDGTDVDSYEITTEFKGADPTRQMMQTIAFGRAGIKGFVAEVDGGVVVTFSQRPDVLSAGLKAAAGEETLAKDTVLRQLRAWLPPASDIEIFFGVGPIGKLIGQLASMLPIDQAKIPQIDPATKPVALGIEVSNGVIETGWVIPADVMAIIFDAAADRIVRPGDRMGIDD